MNKEIKIAYFPANATKSDVTTKLGEPLDNYCTSCKTEEQLTGNYVLDMVLVADTKLIEDIKEEVILKVKMDYGSEYFRITKVTKDLRYITVVARQLVIQELLAIWLADVRAEGLNGNNALNWLLDKATGVKQIELSSDITKLSTAYYIRKNLYEAVFDCDQSFINRWGGEAIFRGYKLIINNSAGSNKGFVIQEKKNLTGFNCVSNIDNLYTRIQGEAYNGILGNYVDSPIINQYNRVYTTVKKYDDIKLSSEEEETEYKTEAEVIQALDERAAQEFSVNNLDKINADYTINFVDLSKTEEYKNYQLAEKVGIGDTIQVKIDRLGVTLSVKAIEKKYNVLTQETEEIKLSNYVEPKKLTVEQLAEKINNIEVPDMENFLEQAQQATTDIINAGLKNSYVIVRENEILIMDTKDINTAQNVWKWTNGGLGYSSNGYYGNFSTAITGDGKIVADFISVGILSANLIKSGVLASQNGNMSINMDNGTIKYLNSLGTGLRINSDGLIFYEDNVKIGNLLTSHAIDNPNIKGTAFVLNNKNNNYFSINTLIGDSADIEGGTWEGRPIAVFSSTKNSVYNSGMNMYDRITIRKNSNGIIFSDNAETLEQGSCSAIWNNSSDIYKGEDNADKLCIYGKNGIYFGYRADNGNSYYRMEIRKNANSYGDTIILAGSVADINGNKYYKQNYCPSCKTDNLNSLHNGGFYYFEGATGAPCYKGTVVVISAGNNSQNPSHTDTTQLVVELQAHNRPDIYYRSILDVGTKWSGWQKVTTEWWNG